MIRPHLSNIINDHKSPKNLRVHSRHEVIDYELNMDNRKWPSYIDSPKWLKNKKATINPKDNDNNCFQYALTAALNYKNIKNHPERISDFKPFINKYDWKAIDFPSHLKDWKEFELNKQSISLNILFVPYNTEKIRRAYPQKNHSKLLSFIQHKK